MIKTVAIISSSKDPAGINIRQNLIKHYEFKNSSNKFDGNDIFESKLEGKTVKLYLTNGELTHSEKH